MAVLEIKTNGVHQPHYSVQTSAYTELEHRGETEGLAFDSDRHLFTLEGEILPSVTQVLKAEGFCPDFSMIDPYYLMRGQYVHKTTQLWDNDELDEDTLDDQLRPYLESYKKAKQEKGFEVLGCEVQRYNKLYKFAGIIDRIIAGTKSYILYLTPGINAGYKFEEVKYSKADLSVFLCALNTYRWKKNNLKGE
jgi:hypothetical protein